MSPEYSALVVGSLGVHQRAHYQRPTRGGTCMDSGVEKGGRWVLSARLCPAQSGQVQLEHGPMGGAMLPWSETGRW
jgi:hypothetical protein